MHIDYDGGADVLYISFYDEPSEDNILCHEDVPGILVRVNERTEKVTGFTVINFQGHLGCDAAEALKNISIT